MKQLLVAIGLLTSVLSFGQGYKVIAIIESLVQAGLGRSRIIETDSEMDVDQFTTHRLDGKKSRQGDVKRKDAKVNECADSKTLNFYSAVGTNFQNIASNDALIADKINKLCVRL